MPVIGLDVRMIEHSGIGTSIRGLLDHFDAAQRRQLRLFSPLAWENPYACDHVPVRYPVYSLSQHVFYGSFLKKQPIDLYHMPHYDIPYNYNEPYVATVHDLIHHLFPHYSTKPFSGFYARTLLRRVVARAVKLIVVSENTKKDLIDLCPDARNKVEVIYPGVEKDFSPVEGDRLNRVMETYGLKPGYLLYVGNLRASKNTEGLIHAYELLRKKRKGHCPDLVLAGHNSLKRYKTSFPKGIRYLGQVPYGDLPALYSGAGIFVFPSLYEGFGLPPLEAMACGTPVVVSDRASLPEVCGNAARYVIPTALDDLAEAISELLDDIKKREELTKKGLQNVSRFSWNSFAQKTWTVYQDVLSQLGKSK